MIEFVAAGSGRGLARIVREAVDIRSHMRDPGLWPVSQSMRIFRATSLAAGYRQRTIAIDDASFSVMIPE